MILKFQPVSLTTRLSVLFGMMPVRNDAECTGKIFTGKVTPDTMKKV